KEPDMADLQALRDFADDNDFGLTGPLTARQARELAEYWLPDLHFHEDERFHPIALSDVFDMVESHLATMPPEVREQWRLGIRQRGVDENGVEIARSCSTIRQCCSIRTAASRCRDPRCAACSPKARPCAPHWATPR